MERAEFLAKMSAKQAQLLAEQRQRENSLLAEQRHAVFESSLLQKELGLVTEKEKEMYSYELQSIKKLKRLKAKRLFIKESSSLSIFLLLSGSNKPPDVSSLEPSANWLEAGLPAD